MADKGKRMIRPSLSRGPVILCTGVILAFITLALHAEVPRAELASEGSWESWRDEAPLGGTAFWAATSGQSSELRVLFVPPACSLGVVIYRDHDFAPAEPVNALPKVQFRVRGKATYTVDAWVTQAARDTSSRTIIKSQPDGTELRKIFSLLRSGPDVDIQITPDPQDPDRYKTWTGRFMLDGFDAMYARANRLCK